MKKHLITATVAIAFFCVLSGCTNRERTEIDHVFLITIDTLRADHLGYHGYARTTSPFIDSMAHRSITFTNAFAQSSTTCPSHASILTGLYPSQHRVLANAYILEDSFTTLPEILKKNGFTTAGFTSTPYHFLRSNMQQGFDFYEEPPLEIREKGADYRMAQYTLDNAITWLYNFPNKDKLFLWIHLFDPHIPYLAPRKHFLKVKNEIPKKKYLEYLKRFNINLEVFDGSIEKMFTIMNDYDAEIAYVDEQLERFFTFVEDKGLNKNSLWIITSDHGESLGQHDWMLHGKTLHQEEIHVPLLFHFTESAFPPMKIEDVVENFDIFTTLLDMLNIELDDSLQEEVKAISLYGRMKNEMRLEKDHALSERRRFDQPKEWADDVPPWKRNTEEGEKFSIQNNDSKLIFNKMLGEQFYTLTKDPLELNDLSGGPQLKQKDELMRTLVQYMNQFIEYQKKKFRVADRETILRLKSLGYIF